MCSKKLYVYRSGYATHFITHTYVHIKRFCSASESERLMNAWKYNKSINCIDDRAWFILISNWINNSSFMYNFCAKKCKVSYMIYYRFRKNDKNNYFGD